MKKILVVVCVIGACVSGLAAQKTVYRDAQGRLMGSASTDRYGKTTFRDAQGRNMGSFSIDRYGKTTYRDAQGRIQGTRK